MPGAPHPNQDIRWRQRFQNFKKAFAQLSAARDLTKQRKLSNLEQQGLIQAFEFTHELAWNTLKDFLEHHGAIGIYGSRDATREVFAKGLIEDGELWMDTVQSRNRTTHTYDETTAHEIAVAITDDYCLAFRKLEAALTELEKAGQ